MNLFQHLYLDILYAWQRMKLGNLNSASTELF